MCVRKISLIVLVCAICLTARVGGQILPDDWDGEKWIFNNAMCVPWINPQVEDSTEPMVVTGFEFGMITEGYNFAAIAFPTGFGFDGDVFTITDENDASGVASPIIPQSVNDWYIFTPPFPGCPGVRWFTVTGINIEMDPGDPEDQDMFPWWLQFCSCPPPPGVSYWVKPIPEPVTLTLLGVGALALLRRRK